MYAALHGQLNFIYKVCFEHLLSVISFCVLFLSNKNFVNFSEIMIDKSKVFHTDLCKKTTSTSTSSLSSCRKSFKKWLTDSYVMCPHTTICLKDHNYITASRVLSDTKQCYYRKLPLKEALKRIYLKAFIDLI